MKTALAAGFALIGGLALAQAQAQTPNAPANTPGVSGPVPGSAAPGMPGAPAVGTTSHPGAAVETPVGPGRTMGTAGTTAVTRPGTGNGIVDRNTGKAAAGGEDNQAVATTNANASQPAHGANSFTRGEARGRIADNGYQNVSNLRKDGQGVWRGKAMKNGASVNVWLDYKGNVGQQ